MQRAAPAWLRCTGILTLWDEHGAFTRRATCPGGCSPLLMRAPPVPPLPSTLLLLPQEGDSYCLVFYEALDAVIFCLQVSHQAASHA